MLPRQVPIIQNDQKIVEVQHVQHLGKVVDVPVLLQRQVPVIEKVQIPVVVSQKQYSDKIVKVPVVTQRQVPNIQNEVAQVMSCENTISLHQLARQIASAQCFKSPGLDGITNDMLKGSPQQVARHLHPLLCKMSLMQGTTDAEGQLGH